MKSSLPILTVLVGSTLAAITAAQDSHAPADQRAAGQVAPLAKAAAPRRQPPSPPADRQAGLDRAQLMVRSAAQMLAGQESLAAKLRLRVCMFGEHLLGTGSYYQGPAGSDRLRFEMKLQAGDQVTSLLEIADGHYLWIHQDVLGSTNLERVDLGRLAELAPAAPGSQQHLLHLGGGGLPRLLWELAERFEFEIRGLVQSEEAAAWQLFGRWRATGMPARWHAAVERTSDDELERLPDHLPHGVRLHLERDSLLPLRVEFVRRGTTPLGYSGPETTPDGWVMASLDLYDVQVRVRIDPRAFTYQPGDQSYRDITDELIRRVRQAASP